MHKVNQGAFSRTALLCSEILFPSLLNPARPSDQVSTEIAEAIPNHLDSVKIQVGSFSFLLKLWASFVELSPSTPGSGIGRRSSLPRVVEDALGRVSSPTCLLLASSIRPSSSLIRPASSVWEVTPVCWHC